MNEIPQAAPGAGSAEERTQGVSDYFGGSSTYWDRVYTDHSVQAQVYRRRHDVVMRHALKVSRAGDDVIDVGTGAGHLAVALAQHGLRVVAVDASASMLAHVTANARDAGVTQRVTPWTSDAQQLQLPSSSFQVGIAVGLLPWVEHPEVALAEIARITKPGGHVVVTMDNRRGVARWLDPGWHAPAREWIRHFRQAVAPWSLVDAPSHWPASMTSREFIQLLRADGLVPLQVAGIGFGPFTFLGRTVLPNAVGLLVDRALQRVATRLPLLGRAANFHVALAAKPDAYAGGSTTRMSGPK